MALKLAVLLSGGGRTLQNFFDRIDDGSLDAEVRVVIADRPGVKGLDRARARGVDAVLVERQQCKGAEAFSEADALANRFTEMMHGDEAAAKDNSLGDLRALQGVSKFPVRIKCALIGFDALQEALKKNALEDGH